MVVLAGFAEKREKARSLSLRILDQKTFVMNRSGQNAPNYG